MNTTILRIWFGQIAIGIGPPITGVRARGAFVSNHAQATIARLFDGRTTGGEVRNY